MENRASGIQREIKMKGQKLSTERSFKYFGEVEIVAENRNSSQ